MEEPKEKENVLSEPGPDPVKKWWQNFIRWENLTVIVVMVLFLFLAMNISNFVGDCNRHWLAQAEAKGWTRPENYTDKYDYTHLYIGGVNGS